MVALLAQPLGRLLKAVLSAQLSNGQRTGKDLPHLPKLKLVALCNRFGVHGLFRSLVVAFLAIAVRSNSGFRTAIIRMLVFHRGTSALPVHNGPLRGAHSTPAYLSKTTSFRFQDDLCRARCAVNPTLWTSGGAPAPMPKQCRSDQFYPPE